MLDDFGDEVSFEDLDPCCQKEVIGRKHYNDVTKKLRKSDQSQIRLDLKDKTFTNLWKDSKCQCCNGSTDYFLLAQLKLNQDFVLNINDDYNKESDGDNDSDFELDDPSFISEFELEQKLKFEEYQQNLKKAKTYGFGIHVEDSIDHIIHDILFGIPTIIHVYNPQLLICAKLDLFFENQCLKYLGTRFRRIFYSSDLFNYTNKMEILGIKNTNIITSNGTLLCFVNKYLKSFQSSINEFAVDDILYNEEVMKFLNTAQVLTTDIPLVFTNVINNKTNQNNNILITNDNDDIELFCDDPDCTKRYKHEHIKSHSNNNKQYQVPSFLLQAANSQGEEVFAKNALLHL